LLSAKIQIVMNTTASINRIAKPTRRPKRSIIQPLLRVKLPPLEFAEAGNNRHRPLSKLSV
jgi:hypothetical protein